MSKEKQALLRIADEFVGILYEDLSKAEQKVLKIALDALNLKLVLDEFGQVSRAGQ